MLLQFGLPGLAELVIILLVLLLLGIPTVAAIAVAFFLYRASDGGADDERVEELESEVQRLREEIATEMDSGDGDEANGSAGETGPTDDQNAPDDATSDSTGDSSPGDDQNSPAAGAGESDDAESDG